MKWFSALLRCGSLRPAMGRKHRATHFVALALCVAGLLAGAARAEDDLPERVGRIADFAGQLFLSPQDRPDEWASVEVNYTVTSGDNLWVSGDGHAEVDYGGGQFRVAGDTNLNVSRLDDRQLTLFVAAGSVIVRVRVLDPGDAVRIDTPNTQVALTRPGLYRVEVAPDRQDTTVSVREGESLIGLTGGTQQALAGQTITVTGPDPAVAAVRNGVGVDGFDAWSADRDRHYEYGAATAYVSRQMVGYAELDANGTWDRNATYGAVWYPAAVPADWAPYSDGYWTNVGGWGPTWVDAAPWGYAPSHYGRWVHVGGRWGWCPGGYAARPRWAPALVGWVGGGGWGLAANTRVPIYGWVPLGWGDAYHPWWRRCSNNCWSRYNQPFAVDVATRPAAPPARYSNASVPGAMTAVSGATIVGRLPVHVNRVVLGSAIVASAPVLASLPLAPSGAVRRAVRPGERGTPVPASTVYASTPRNPATALLLTKSRPAQPATAPQANVTASPPTGASQASVMTSPNRAGSVAVPAPTLPNRSGGATLATPQAHAPTTVNPSDPATVPAKQGNATTSQNPGERSGGPAAPRGNATNDRRQPALPPNSPGSLSGQAQASGQPQGSLRSAAPVAPAAGIALPPPRAVDAPAPQPPAHVPVPPSLVSPVVPVVIPAPLPAGGAQDRSPARPADSDAARGNRNADRNAPIVILPK